MKKIFLGILTLSATCLIACQSEPDRSYYSSVQVIDANQYVSEESSSSVKNITPIIKEQKTLALEQQSKTQEKDDFALDYNQYASNNTSGYGVIKPYVPDGGTVVKKEVKKEAQVTKVAPVQVVQNTKVQDKYVVKKGDTLYSIAFRYGLDYKFLAKKNNIAPPYNISVGQVINLNINSSAAPVYIVKKGDTLYSIAKKQNQSVSFLAGVNDLNPPYNLYVGQKLNLARSNSYVKNAKKEESEVPVAGNTVVSNKNTNTVAKNSVVKTPIIAGKSRTVNGVTWTWPTQGKVIKGFSLGEQGNKGIDIAGTRGQPVVSTADGQVVYAGNALRGFGNLIIINHSNEYLSAYAHNDALLVKEGDKVKRGQQIARMGSTDAESVRLHFEIRYRGQSVNPTKYLPIK